MSEAEFNPLIHEVNRLKICALLSCVKEMEFMALREEMQLSDSALSKHIKALEQAEFIQTVKRPFSGRTRKWIMMTQNGQHVYVSHIKALKDIVGE